MRWPEQWNSETTDRGWHCFRRATILNGAQRSATGLGAGWRVSDVIGRTAAMSSGKVIRLFTYHGPVRPHDEPKDLEDDAQSRKTCGTASMRRTE